MSGVRSQEKGFSAAESWRRNLQEAPCRCVQRESIVLAFMIAKWKLIKLRIHKSCQNACHAENVPQTQETAARGRKAVVAEVSERACWAERGALRVDWIILDSGSVHIRRKLMKGKEIPCLLYAGRWRIQSVDIGR